MDLKLYINGEWKDSSDKQTREIINPANKKMIARAAEGTVEDAKEAIQAAKKAFNSGVWANKTAQERAGYLFKIADKIDEKREKLIDLEVENNGKTRPEAEFDIDDSAGCFRYYAGLVITGLNGNTVEVPEPVQSVTVHEPIGVAGLIVPWNFPMLMGIWKIAPALAAGNSIVFKPAEITPVTTTFLFEIMEEVGLPKGVANLVSGSGAIIGQTISESMDVDVVSFTGSTATGRKIMHAATGNLKKVALELGGKSPNIIFADADMETAVDYGLFGIFYGAGQVCNAGSRILVEDSIYDEYLEKFIAKAKNIKVGPGNVEGMEMGAIVSEAQMNTVLNYIKIGKDEGATLALGGNRMIENGLDKGYFIEPTIFTDVSQEMRIVQEEIFGPVVTIQKFKDEAEAIELANDVDYGLAGGVFSKDGAKAMRVMKGLRAGVTWINTFHASYNETPWGGYKQSGIGRGLGTYGLDTFQEVKQISVNLQVEPTGWYK